MPEQIHHKNRNDTTAYFYSVLRRITTFLLSLQYRNNKVNQIF